MNRSVPLFLLFLTGCAVGPDYKPPESTLSEAWAAPTPHSTLSSETPITQWW